MSFLSPLFLVGLAAAAIPIVIHLLHRRTEPVIEFAALRYLRRAPADQSRRRRLKELLLLALRVSALALLAVAFARPYLTQASPLAAPATMVLVDTSASLSAPGQFERARRLAEDTLRAAPPTHAVGLATFAGGVEVAAPLSQDRARALAAVAHLKAGAGATRYQSALGRAAEQLGSRPGRIVVITDLQQSGWDAADATGVPEAIDVEIRDAGAPAGNLAVLSLAVEGDDAVAVVRNFASSNATGQVSFAMDGRPIGAVPMTIAANAAAEARLAFGSATGPRTGPRALTATVTDPSGYSADDTRFAVLDGGAAATVLVVTPSGRAADAFYLDRALTVAGRESGFAIRPIAGASFVNLAPTDLAGVDVIAILGTRGLERRGRELVAAHVRSGHGLLLTAGPEVDSAILGGLLDGVVGTSWLPRDAATLSLAPDDSRHPVFRPFGGVGTLANVSFRQSAAMRPGDAAQVLARYSDGSPALVEERVGDGRVLLFASDLNNRWNDFPLQPAFVPFVHEAMRYLASARPRRTSFAVGELMQQAASVPGIVELDGGVRVAVNVDQRESDPGRMTAEAFRAGVSRLKEAAAGRTADAAREREDGQRLWQLGLAAMLVLLVSESVLGRRLV